MDKKMKVVLAYSGGLDTTVIIPWLKENYNCDVIAACIDVGQGKETDGLEERALKSGASKFYLKNVTEEFITDYIYPTLKADDQGIGASASDHRSLENLGYAVS